MSKPNTSRNHLRLLYSPGRVASGKTQVGADLGLHQAGNPRACAPSGQKDKDSVSSLWDKLKRSNIGIIGVPEEAKEQEFGNLFEKIMKENFPNLVKEIDMQVQEAQSPKQDGCKEAHSKIHHN